MHNFIFEKKTWLGNGMNSLLLLVGLICKSLKGFENPLCTEIATKGPASTVKVGCGSSNAPYKLAPQ